MGIIHVYQVSFENVERFLSNEVRLKFCETIAQLFFFEKIDELNLKSL